MILYRSSPAPSQETLLPSLGKKNSPCEYSWLSWTWVSMASPTRCCQILKPSCSTKGRKEGKEKSKGGFKSDTDFLLKAALSIGHTSPTPLPRSDKRDVLGLPLALETHTTQSRMEGNFWLILIAYSEQCWIRDLQRRRFSFGTRDQA